MPFVHAFTNRCRPGLVITAPPISFMLRAALGRVAPGARVAPARRVESLSSAANQRLYSRSGVRSRARGILFVHDTIFCSA